MVKRWTSGYSGGDGHFMEMVAASDYDALEAQLKQESNWRKAAQSRAPFIELREQGRRIAQLEAALRGAIDYIELDSEHPDMRYAKGLLTASETKAEPMPVGEHPMGGPCIHVWAQTNRSAIRNGKCSICGSGGDKP